MGLRIFKIDSDRNLAGVVTEAFQRKGVAGASEINNWMRAGFVILPYSDVTTPVEACK